MQAFDTARLRFAAPHWSQARGFYRYARHPLVCQNVLWEPHKSVLQSFLFLWSLRRQNERGEQMTYVVMEKANGRIIGTMGFNSLFPDGASAEVGYSFHPQCWGKGYATEGLTALVALARALRFRHLFARCFVRNGASRRVLEKCGFTRTGRSQQPIFKGKDWLDVMELELWL